MLKSIIIGLIALCIVTIVTITIVDKWNIDQEWTHSIIFHANMTHWIIGWNER